MVHQVLPHQTSNMSSALIVKGTISILLIPNSPNKPETSAVPPPHIRQTAYMTALAIHPFKIVGELPQLAHLSTNDSSRNRSLTQDPAPHPNFSHLSTFAKTNPG